MKKFIWLGITVFGGIGGWLGSLLDGTGFGLWSILLTMVGSLVGVWLGYLVGKNYG